MRDFVDYNLTLNSDSLLKACESSNAAYMVTQDVERALNEIKGINDIARLWIEKEASWKSERGDGIHGPWIPGNRAKFYYTVCGNCLKCKTNEHSFGYPRDEQVFNIPQQFFSDPVFRKEELEIWDKQIVDTIINKEKDDRLQIEQQIAAKKEEIEKLERKLKPNGTSSISPD